MTSDIVSPADAWTLRSVLAAIARERARQDAKWGHQDHDPVRWISTLAEDVGEADEAALQSIEQGLAPPPAAGHEEEEVPQLTAVAVCAVQCFRRRGAEGIP